MGCLNGSIGVVLTAAVVLLLSKNVASKSLNTEDLDNLLELLTRELYDEKELIEKNDTDDYSIEFLEIQDCFPNPEALCYPLTPQDKDDLDWMEMSETEMKALETEYDKLVEDTMKVTKRSSGSEIEVDSAIHSRKRRNAVMIIGGLTLLWRSWAVTNSASEGCHVRPSICIHREHIEEVNAQIEVKLDEYNYLYTQSLDYYLQLKDLLYNNAFAIHYNDEAIRSLGTFADFLDSLFAVLATDFEDLVKELDQGDVTQDEFVVLILNPLERILNRIQGMFEEQQVTSSSAQAIALKLFLDSTVTKYLNTISTTLHAQDVILSDGQLGNILYPEQQLTSSQIDALHDPSSSAHRHTLELTAAFVKGGYYHLGLSLAQRLPLVAECFIEATHRPFIYTAPVFSDGGDSIFKGRNKLNNAKASYYNAVHSSLFDYHSLQSDVKSDRWNQFSAAGFKYHWDEYLTTRVNITINKLYSMMTIGEFAEVAKEYEYMADVYDKYYSDLTEAHDTLVSDLEAMTTVFADSEANFQNIAIAARDAIAKIINDDSLQLLVAINRDFSFDSPPTMAGYWGNAGDRIRKRADVLQYFGDVASGYDSTEASVHSRVTYYSRIAEDVAANEPVTDMYDVLSLMTTSSLAYEARQFGEGLTQGDVLCDIAGTFVMRSTYDFYDLNDVRAACNKNDMGYVTALQMNADNERFEAQMVPWIQIDVDAATDVPVASTLDSIKRAFKLLDDPAADEFALKLTTIDILCVVTSLVPAHTETYDFYGLEPFRALGAAQCPNMNRDTWNNVVQQRNALQSLMTRLTPDIDICNRHQFCTCWLDLQIRYRANEDDIRLAIKHIDGSMTQYCGGSFYHTCPEPECVDLKPEEPTHNTRSMKRNFESFESQMVPWIEIDVEEATDVPVASTLDSIKRAYSLLEDPAAKEFASQLKTLDILCVVTTLVPDNTKTYDFYDLEPFRALGADQCPNMALSTWHGLLQRRNRLQSLVANLEPELDVCERHEFCTCWTDLQIRYRANEDEIRIAISHIDSNMTQYCGGSLYHTCPEPTCVILESLEPKHITRSMKRNYESFESQMVPWIQIDVDDDTNVPVASTLDSIKRAYSLLMDPAAHEFALKLTTIDILCVVTTLVPDNTKTYDFYDLEPYRTLGPDQCPNMALSTWHGLLQRRNRLQSLVANLAPELDVCERHQFCTCWTDFQIRYRANENEIRNAVKHIDNNMTQYCGGSIYHTCPDSCVDL